MTCRFALAPVVAALALAGCRWEQPAEPEPTTDRSDAVPPSPEETPATSIMRPEVLPEPAAPARLEPLEATIPFAEGGNELTAEAEQALAEVVESAQLAEGWPVVLRGHTDSLGSDRANLLTSKRRAEAVADWLVEHGVARERITVIAIGEQRPVAPNAHLDGSADEEGRARNRRVTLAIAPPVDTDVARPSGLQEREAAPDG